jgi:hypothetical protein
MTVVAALTTLTVIIMVTTAVIIMAVTMAVMADAPRALHHGHQLLCDSSQGGFNNFTRGARDTAAVGICRCSNRVCNVAEFLTACKQQRRSQGTHLEQAVADLAAVSVPTRMSRTGDWQEALQSTGASRANIQPLSEMFECVDDNFLVTVA